MHQPYHIPTAVIIAVSAVIFSFLCASPKGRVTARTMLDSSGSKYTETVSLYDGLGRCVQTVQTGVNTSGVPVVKATELNPDGTVRREWIPFAASGVTERIADSNIPAYSRSCHSDSHAYSDITYDALGRNVFTSTPGDAWHERSKGVATAYSANSANSVRRYIADTSRNGVSASGYWPARSLKSVKATDEDGVSVETFADMSGRTVLERRGGDHDTYYVYNRAGQLRFVLQPMFQEDASVEMYAFEYRFDQYGNVVYKSIPGGGYTQYWYDTGRRMTFMQDPNLRSRGLHRFYVYDGLGRIAIQGVSASCTLTTAVNKAEYTGGTSGFMETGYTLQTSSGLRQVTLEIVNYYDGYTFVDALDTQLVQTTQVSAKGRSTGAVVYDSSDGYSLSATYYDILGNVTSQREITDFGTLRVTDCTYTFTGQPLTMKETEADGPTVMTQNTYDVSSGLLKQTDVTVNGTKASVAKYTYDDFGRMATLTRGGNGGTVTHTYDVHGKTKSISGPGITQKLYYADGPGTKLYNGSVSSMTWTMGTDQTIRGYKYSYNGYGWLTTADYGEGTSLSANKDRYSEKSTAFTKNGSVTTLQRHGLMASGAYGKVDDLTISYSGNRIASVTDAAPAVTQTGSMDYAGGSTPKTFAFNSSGALVKDESRKITSISYDTYGYPSDVAYSNRSRTQYVYSATGTRLCTVHSTEMTGGVVTAGTVDTDLYGLDDFTDESFGSSDSTDGQETGILGLEDVEYHGNTIWRNGKVDMVLFAGGYATLSNGKANGTPTFHYYTADYLGNVRAVINGSTGAVEQTVSYYPYGGVIPDLSSAPDKQPYKFGGKELTVANGLNEYDFGARQYWQAVPGFTSIDPCSEDYTWLSPYLYCGNNPVNMTDFTGEAPSEEEAARMADYVYGKDNVRLTGGWKVSNNIPSSDFRLNNDETGFASLLFERTVNGVTEYAYAFAGTDPTSIEDWGNNISQLTGNSAQYNTAMQNAKSLKMHLNEELTYVGHSLGGGLAAASAYATGGHAMTFNAAGVSNMTIDTTRPANIEAFVTRRDELNALQISYNLPTANGNVCWRNGNSSLLGHSIKNFYETSISKQIYNRVLSTYIRFSNSLKNALNPYAKF